MNSNLVSEATRFARQQSHQAIPFLDTSTASKVAVEMVRSFERCTILANAREEERVLVAMIVALTASTAIFQSFKDDLSKEYTAQIYSVIQINMKSASTFAYQSGQPLTPTLTSVSEFKFETRRAIWASRKLDAPSRRNIKVGIGVDALVSQLVDLNIDSDPNEVSTFYCPMGSDAYGYHTPGMFDILTTGKHVVVFEPLLRQMDMLVDNVIFVRPNMKDTQTRVLIDALNIGERVTGNARHPLTLQLQGNEIRVQLAEHINDLASNRSDILLAYETTTLIDCLDLTSEFQDPESLMQNKITRMRSLVYNAERLFHSISLASSLESSTCLIQGLTFKVQDERDSVAVAIALAMFETQTGISFSEVSLLIVSYLVDSAKDQLSRANAKVKKAAEAGCKYCFLSELCLSL